MHGRIQIVFLPQAPACGCGHRSTCRSHLAGEPKSDRLKRFSPPWWIHALSLDPDKRETRPSSRLASRHVWDEGCNAAKKSHLPIMVVVVAMSANRWARMVWNVHHSAMKCSLPKILGVRLCPLRVIARCDCYCGCWAWELQAWHLDHCLTDIPLRMAHGSIALANMPGK